MTRSEVLSAYVFRCLLLVLVLAVALNGLAFIRLNPDRIVTGTDSPVYDLMARQLADGRGLTAAIDPPFLPTVEREPGYPLFVASVYRLAGPNPDVVAAIQVVALALTAGLVAVLGTRLFGPVAGLLGAAIFGLSSEVAHYAHWLLTEVPFTLLLVTVVLLALRAQAKGRRSDYLATGVGIGLATLVRVIAGSLVVPLVVVLAFTGQHRGRRSMLARCGLLLAGLAVVLAPWLARNLDAVGRPILTTRFGANLVRRAPRAAEPLSAYPSWIVASAWIATNPLSQLVYPIDRFQWGPNYEDNLIWDFHVNEAVRYGRRYEPACLPTPDPDGCLADVGMAFVRAYPLGFVVQSAFELVKLHFAPLPGPQALVHNATVWLGIVGAVVLARRRQLRRAHVLVLGVLTTYVAGSVVLDTQVRYLVPVLPIYATFGAVPLVEVAGLVLWRVRAQRHLSASSP